MSGVHGASRHEHAATKDNTWEDFLPSPDDQKQYPAHKTQMTHLITGRREDSPRATSNENRQV